MAGCFGNHPIDRWMENQLFQYLDEEEEYEKLYENITSFLNDDFYNKNEERIDLWCRYLIRKINKGMLTIQQSQNLIFKLCTQSKRH